MKHPNSSTAKRMLQCFFLIKSGLFVTNVMDRKLFTNEELLTKKFLTYSPFPNGEPQDPI